ncbi:SymE family type I addiction module toxin [Gilliamella apicola]
MKERWLEQIGFYAGLPVAITIECGQLIIKPTMKI